MRAMILAAGFGTRLWPLTIGRTKPAIPFLNRPLIAYTLDYLRKAGIDDVIVNLHHEPDSVKEQIGDGSVYGVRIRYSVEEPEILGTSGALDNVRDLLSDSPFVVINGKIITDVDLEAAALEPRSLTFGGHRPDAQTAPGGCSDQTADLLLSGVTTRGEK